MPRDVEKDLLADQPVEDIALRLLTHLFAKGANNRLHAMLAELAKSMSPHELAAVYKCISAMTTDEGREAFAKIAPMWTIFQNNPGRVYSREVLFDGTTLFRSAVQAEKRPAIVCFTSRTNGMFMPNCRFLELLGSYPVDIVFNMTETGTFGDWKGGRARSFAESLARLKRKLAKRGIAPTVYVGASAGGGPSVYAAALDKGVPAVMFSGRFYVPGRGIPLREAGTAFEPICACREEFLPQVYSIFGALTTLDKGDDARLRALVPQTKSYPIPRDDKHGPMTTLTARRKLRYVIERLYEIACGTPSNFDQVTLT